MKLGDLQELIDWADRYATTRGDDALIERAQTELDVLTGVWENTGWEMEYEVTYALPVEEGSDGRPHRGSSGVFKTERDAIDFAASCSFEDAVIMRRTKGVPAGEWVYMPLEPNND